MLPNRKSVKSLKIHVKPIPIYVTYTLFIHSYLSLNIYPQITTTLFNGHLLLYDRISTI